MRAHPRRDRHFGCARSWRADHGRLPCRDGGGYSLASAVQQAQRGSSRSRSLEADRVRLWRSCAAIAPRRASISQALVERARFRGVGLAYAPRPLRGGSSIGGYRGLFFARNNKEQASLERRQGGGGLRGQEHAERERQALSETEVIVAALEALHRGDFGHRLVRATAFPRGREASTISPSASITPRWRSRESRASSVATARWASVFGWTAFAAAGRPSATRSTR